MKYYSEYTIKYVQDICDAFNDGGLIWGKNPANQIKKFSPEMFDTLTEFLQDYVIWSLDLFTFLNSQGLINRGRCPYTGQSIDNSFPKWTFMRTRSIYVSHEGLIIMQKEADEKYEKNTGMPAPKRSQQRQSNGCYIATVCYGDEFAPEVITLKKYRDKILSKSFIGKTFIKFYYLVSPTISRHLQNKRSINNYLRKNILDRIVNKINKR
jgi:hypothetical protein